MGKKGKKGDDGMSGAIRVFPNVEDMFACAEVQCAFLDTDTLEGCKKRACPFAFQRQREEDQADRDRKDAERRKEG